MAAGQQATSICVPRLIQARVDVVLRNLLTECGMEDGRWRHDMGPGCTMIEAAVFGYRVGVRRSRQDLIGIGERTAAAEAAAVSRIMPNLLRGGTDGCWAAIHGLPALFLSGKYSGNARHGQLFGTAFAPLRLAARLDHRREVMWAGVAAAFAQLYGDSGRRDLQKLSWEPAARRCLEVYRKVIRR